MRDAGIAIVPCSGIVFEALACGNICISGVYNENQQKIYSGFKQMGAFIDGGTFNKDEITAAIDRIEDFQIKKVIDGKSPERIQHLFKNI